MRARRTTPLLFTLISEINGDASTAIVLKITEEQLEKVAQERNSDKAIILPPKLRIILETIKRQGRLFP